MHSRIGQILYTCPSKLFTHMPHSRVLYFLTIITKKCNYIVWALFLHMSNCTCTYLAMVLSEASVMLVCETFKYSSILHPFTTSFNRSSCIYITTHLPITIYTTCKSICTKFTVHSVIWHSHV